MSKLKHLFEDLNDVITESKTQYKDIEKKLLSGPFKKQEIDRFMNQNQAEFMKLVNHGNLDKGISLFYDLSDYEVETAKKVSSRNPWDQEDYYDQLTNYMAEIAIYEFRDKIQATVFIYDKHNAAPSSMIQDTDSVFSMNALKKVFNDAMEYVEERFWEHFRDNQPPIYDRHFDRYY